MPIRIHDRDDGGAMLGAGDVRRARPPDLQYNIGVFHRGESVGRDHGTCERVFLIRNAGFKSGAGLDLDLRAEAHKFFNRLGRRRDTALGGIVFGGNGNQHEWLRKSLKLRPSPIFFLRSSRG
jgi:hypothetical protein